MADVFTGWADDRAKVKKSIHCHVDDNLMIKHANEYY
jgi:hypothetical protein